MIAIALFLAYAGVVLCYVASPQTPVVEPSAVVRRALRLGGGAAMVAALVLLAMALHGITGVLVGLTVLMLASSAVVIGAPLVPRFIPLTTALAFVLAVVAAVAA